MRRLWLRCGQPGTKIHSGDPGLVLAGKILVQDEDGEDRQVELGRHDQKLCSYENGDMLHLASNLELASNGLFKRLRLHRVDRLVQRSLADTVIADDVVELFAAGTNVVDLTLGVEVHGD